jgi:glycosyltransferase involved in cell wall biosynthesis
VVGSGIDIADYPRLDAKMCRRRLGLPENAFLLLFLARKEAYKGLQLLFAACAQLQTECPDLYLIAAGTETDHSRDLRKRYADLPRVFYFDTVYGQPKLDLLNACDVFAMPSMGESFGIVYVEAWAVGKPVLAANAGAIPSVVSDGVDGLLVTSDSVSNTADRILMLYRNPELRERLGMAGYHKAVTRYSVQRVTDAVEGAYLRTVRTHNNARTPNSAWI